MRPWLGTALLPNTIREILDAYVGWLGGFLIGMLLLMVAPWLRPAVRRLWAWLNDQPHPNSLAGRLVTLAGRPDGWYWDGDLHGLVNLLPSGASVLVRHVRTGANDSGVFCRFAEDGPEEWVSLFPHMSWSTQERVLRKLWDAYRVATVMDQAVADACQRRRACALYDALAAADQAPSAPPASGEQHN